MSGPVLVPWPPIVAGDTMRVWTMTLTSGTEDGPPEPITWASMQVRDPDGTVLKDWATDGDGMVLVSGPNGQVLIGPWDVDLEPGRYHYDIAVRLASDDKTLTLMGGEFPVLGEVPR